MKFLFRLIIALSLLAIIGIITAGGVITWGLWHYGRGLPDHQELIAYEPATSTRLHAGDGRLLAEYAVEKRVFVPVSAMPELLVNAFIAAEDQRFRSHMGVDFIALSRAIMTNIVYYIKGQRLIGASTITQQVAKNFLLTNEFSMERKIKEAILAFRIDRTLTKDRVLELYLNEIYLGRGTYGVASAALHYFDKGLDELSLAEIAYLAILPKAPNNYHPVRNHDAALARRNWVLERMLEDGVISREMAEHALQQPLISKKRRNIAFVEADYFLEEVRRELLTRFGEKRLYKGGLSVRSTLDPTLQNHARQALRQGLIAYDRRHGYRGPLTRIENLTNWNAELKKVKAPGNVLNWQLVVVTSVHDKQASIGFVDGTSAILSLKQVKWARRAIRKNGVATRGAAIKKMQQVVAPGDVIFVDRTENNRAEIAESQDQNDWILRQIPALNGAIVVMDPHTGRVLAMAGGWSFATSQFNRATQALRQPGSAIKPFVYLSALEQGLTPATIILDAPFVLDQGGGLGKWKPANYSKKFYGPSPMRVGIEKSRNLMTVRLAKTVGMANISKLATRFGIMDHMPEQLSMALGAGATYLMNITTAYAALVNGGKKITPTLIDRIQNRHGKTIFRHDRRPCLLCQPELWDNQLPPSLPDNRVQLTDPAYAYQIVTMLEGVVKRGTGRRIASIGKPLAGKTGTTNKSRDAWFIGFSPDLAVGVFVGFDTPTSLGEKPGGSQETGSSVAVPIFKSFMEMALAHKPASPFRTPANVRTMRIDAKTGKIATATSTSIIREAFKIGNEPALEDDGIYIHGGQPETLSSTPGSNALPTYDLY